MDARGGGGNGLLGLLAVAAMAILLWQPAPALAQSPPDAVGSITLTRSGSTLTVSWNAVSDATKYHALYQADGGGDWLPPRLQEHHRYQFHLRHRQRQVLRRRRPRRQRARLGRMD